MEGVGEGLDMVGGGGGDVSEDSRNSGLQQVTQGLACLEAVIARVPLHVSLEPRLGEDGSVLLDGIDSPEEGGLLRTGGLLEQSS